MLNKARMSVRFFLLLYYKLMKKIVVASKNPVKIAAALGGFKRMFPGEEFEVEGVGVESGVSNQPMSNDETYQGAFNRAHSAHNLQPDADYWVGLEGGIEDTADMFAFAWMVIIDGDGRIGKGKTGVFFLPSEVASLIRGGMELGIADDIVFSRTNSKQAGGAIGLLTDNVIDREAYYTEAIIFALIPFKHPEFYPL